MSWKQPQCEVRLLFVQWHEFRHKNHAGDQTPQAQHEAKVARAEIGAHRSRADVRVESEARLSANRTNARQGQQTIEQCTFKEHL